MTRYIGLWFAFSVLIVLCELGLGAQRLYGPYKADLIEVVNGSTLNVRLYLWPNLEQEILIKLDDVYIAESMKTQKHGHDVVLCGREESSNAKQFVEQFLSGKHIAISEVRKKSLGGYYFAKVYADGESLNSAIKEAQLAVDNRYTMTHRWHQCFENNKPSSRQKVTPNKRLIHPEQILDHRLIY